MSYTTLISANELAALLGQSDVLLLDCRHELADPARGARDYAQAHIPGAIHASLDTDLSDLGKTGLGRHPLPDAAVFSATLARWGYRAEQQVVVYDDANGSIAARAWWLLRLSGHRAVAVLDGGLPAWLVAGFATETEVPTPDPTEVAVEFSRQNSVDFAELEKRQAIGAAVLLDARGAPRFRGEIEPIDAVAGHIPGAVNRPFGTNLQADGLFKPGPVLRHEFAALLQQHAPEDVIHSCGSGVTACHNLLAMEHAGLSGSRVFAPSWSGWISDPARAVARGDS